MKKIIYSILAIALIITTISADDTPVDNLDLSVAENMATPVVPPKAKSYVKGAMDQLRRYFVKDGYNVQSLRDGEVLQITIPCSDLFGACAVELKPSAAAVLKPFATVVREPEKYKLLVSVHTDDTGDIMYADSITAMRANAIDDYLWQLASERETNVIPYGIGRDEPLRPNTSILDRAANRRVEFIIIPEVGMLRLAGVKN